MSEQQSEQSQISDEQAQELMDTIADKCDELALEPEQILDGIARALLGASAAFGTKNVSLTIAGVGTCEVLMEEGIANDNMEEDSVAE